MPAKNPDQPLCETCSNYDGGKCAHLHFVWDSLERKDTISECPEYDKAPSDDKSASDSPDNQEK